MPRTRSRTIAFQQNLASPIHRLPNEIIANVFTLGRPPLVRTGISHHDIDLHRYRVLLGSVCQLWRQVARTLPQLWTYVRIRAPDSKAEMEFDRKMLRTVLELSRTSELCLSITPGLDPRQGSPISQYFDDITPHLSRISILFAFAWESRDGEICVIPSWENVEFPKLRHLSVCDHPHNTTNSDSFRSTYLGRVSSFPSFAFPACMRNAPLETLQYSLRASLDITTVPTARLHTIRMKAKVIGRNMTQFIDSFPLRVLHLTVNRWDSNAVLSSKTLVHVELEIGSLGLGISGNFGALPNLLHFSLAGSHVHHDFHFFTQWPDIPSLLSLRVATWGPPGVNIIDLLRKSPRVITLQVQDTDALRVSDMLRARW